MRQDHRCRTPGIVGNLIDIAAKLVQEAAELLLGGMKVSGAGPTGDPINGFVSVFGLYARQFGGDKVEGLIPGHRDKGFVSASRPVTILCWGTTGTTARTAVSGGSSRRGSNWTTCLSGLADTRPEFLSPVLSGPLRVGIRKYGARRF